MIAEDAPTIQMRVGSAIMITPPQVIFFFNVTNLFAWLQEAPKLFFSSHGLLHISYVLKNLQNLFHEVPNFLILKETLRKKYLKLITVMRRYNHDHRFNVFFTPLPLLTTKNMPNYPKKHKITKIHMSDQRIHFGHFTQAIKH